MAGKIIYGSRKNRYFIDDKEVTEKAFHKRFPSNKITGDDRTRSIATLMETSRSWPRKSDAFGVGRRQKKKMEDLCRKKGVPTEYVPDGAGGYSALVRNNAHQRDLLRAFGMHNRDGGYGQVTG